jgi:hypothetical protein
VTVAEWKRAHAAMIDGVATQLCRSAPRKAHRLLAELEARVHQAGNEKERRKVARDFERLVKSGSYFRAAWRRFILASVFQGLDALTQLAEQLDGATETCRRARRAAGDIRWR